MPYAPGITYGNSWNPEAMGQFGQALGMLEGQRQAKAKQAKSYRAILGTINPERKADYEAMSLDELQATHDATVFQRTEIERKQRMKVQQAQIDNFLADNQRAEKDLQLRQQVEKRAASDSSRNAWMGLWEKTMAAKQRADEFAARGKSPVAVDVNGTSFAFSPGTGALHPLERTELTPKERTTAVVGLTGKIDDLYKALDSANRNRPMGEAAQALDASRRRSIIDEISRARRTLDELQGGSGNPAPQSSATRSTAVPMSKGKVLKAQRQMTPQIALEFMRKAGNDRRKAEELAAQAGYTW